MNFRRTFASSALIACWSACRSPPTGRSTEKLDLDAIYRIKDEGLQRSKVMEIESYLTDVYGPRLTGSPNIKEAADWAQKTMKEWGLANVHLETWPFGRGWQNQRFVAHAVTPRAYPLIAYPKAWTPGTNGPVTGEAVMAVINEREGLRHVPRQAARQVRARRRRCATCRRSSRRRATAIPTPSSPISRSSRRPAARTRRPRQPGATRRSRAGRRSSGSTKASRRCSTSAAATAARCSCRRGGSRDPKEPPSAAAGRRSPSSTTAASARTLEKKIPVTLQMDIDNRFYDTDLNAFNIVAELPGTDKADEVVMLGAHFDSWHTGTGATDNAAGSAVMMEAMRMLKASGVKLRRTVRIGLWGGEEQGLLGSKEYVKAHFGDPATMQLKPEHAKFAGYFNVDNGTGRSAASTCRGTRRWRRSSRRGWSRSRTSG